MGKRTFLALWITWGVCGSAWAQAPSFPLAPSPSALPAAATQDRPGATLGVPGQPPAVLPTLSPLPPPPMPTPGGVKPVGYAPPPLPPEMVVGPNPSAFAKFPMPSNDAYLPKPTMLPRPALGDQRNNTIGLTAPESQLPPAFPKDSKPDILETKFVDNYTTLPRTNGASTDTYPNQVYENLSFQIALDGSKEPEDLGINANFGFRVAFNWGIPLVEDLGIGMQIGSALNYSRTAIGVLKLLGGPTDRLQSYTTLGLFCRSDSGWNYGFAYDFRFDDYFLNIDTSQWRAQVSKYITDWDEVGLFGAWRDRIETAQVAGQTLFFRPIDQIALFWRHIWEGDIVTRGWVGLAEEHGRFSLLRPGQGWINHTFAFGADFQVPLNNSLALFGEAHFITPNDTGTVTATLGIAWYPGGGARTTARSRFAPLLPLANNPFFAVDVQQQ
ncbi:MAG: hypothetical protein HY040_12855 [Planctomycetes bacterium]|nr:hypothetical protein [Planctomycetota bacterium]